MSDRRWVRTRTVTEPFGEYYEGDEIRVMVYAAGYQPGDEVVVMSAEDAEEMLVLLREAHSLACHVGTSGALEGDIAALLARLSPGPGPRECSTFHQCGPTGPKGSGDE